ncbi:MAG: helix-turn-helix transcriptional regulator [Deltaproteobacteria bacterium]|nr:helix-turn-helix transcriptional regulator [Deltaproteobacteria bacterium]
MSTVAMQETIPRRRRLSLKAQIYSAGYASLREFAERLGIHPGYLSQILGGIVSPGPAMQRRLAEALGLTIKELGTLL